MSDKGWLYQAAEALTEFLKDYLPGAVAENVAASLLLLVGSLGAVLFLGWCIACRVCGPYLLLPRRRRRNAFNVLVTDFIPSEGHLSLWQFLHVRRDPAVQKISGALSRINAQPADKVRPAAPQTMLLNPQWLALPYRLRPMHGANAIARNDRTLRRWLRRTGYDLAIWGEIETRGPYHIRTVAAEEAAPAGEGTADATLTEMVSLDPAEMQGQLDPVLHALILGAIQPKADSGERRDLALAEALQKAELYFDRFVLPLDRVRQVRRAVVKGRTDGAMHKPGDDKRHRLMLEAARQALDLGRRRGTRRALHLALVWTEALARQYRLKGDPLGEAALRLGCRAEAGIDPDTVPDRVLSAMEGLVTLDLGDGAQAFSDAGLKRLRHAELLLELAKRDRVALWAEMANDEAQTFLEVDWRAASDEARQRAMLVRVNALAECAHLQWRIDATEDALSVLQGSKHGDAWAVARLRVHTVRAAIRNEATELSREIGILQAATPDSIGASASVAIGDRDRALGGAWRELGRITNDPEAVRKAIAAFNDALRVRTERDHPQLWAHTHLGLGEALVMLANMMPGMLDGMAARLHVLEEAGVSFANAARIWGDGNHTAWYDYARQRLDTARRLIAELTGDQPSPASPRKYRSSSKFPIAAPSEGVVQTSSGLAAWTVVPTMRLQTQTPAIPPSQQPSPEQRPRTDAANDRGGNPEAS